jgi:hypothetical protein
MRKGATRKRPMKKRGLSSCPLRGRLAQAPYQLSREANSLLPRGSGYG